MKKLYLFGLIFFIICNACIEDSSLSDVEISDPSLIKPDISIKRTRGNDNLLETEIKVILWDKNLNAIELKKGSVAVNDKTMELKKMAITQAPYYTINSLNLPIELNTEYVFSIELADGEVYKASITTQQTDLNKLTFPENYSKSIDLEITWEGKETQNPLEIHLYGSYTNETVGQTYNVFEPNEAEREAGTYKFPKLYLNKEEGIYKATVKLISEKIGQIDSQFQNGSKIYSKYIKEGEFNVND